MNHQAIFSNSYKIWYIVLKDFVTINAIKMKTVYYILLQSYKGDYSANSSFIKTLNKKVNFEDRVKSQNIFADLFKIIFILEIKYKNIHLSLKITPYFVFIRTNFLSKFTNSLQKFVSMPTMKVNLDSSASSLALNANFNQVVIAGSHTHTLRNLALLLQEVDL
ncbi:hypothetical protein Anas_02900 [Armadillidium nasatum]|uniref:Uncharacterized protein n=1 Tax=Armadillidium nasatum TaxID=96803 RepID=A0A5N5SUQ1_9CRUS|nr:hypothetical protein Anas_02900 [Armadillidium nasatum]